MEHRLMLAIENEQCPGYIGVNVKGVVDSCGAIPIVLSLAGVPDYKTLVGAHFPMVDASEEGWLQQVIQVMRDDDYYHRMLMVGRSRAHERKPSQLARPNWYHCQWHDARLHELPRRRVEWEPCSYCDGEYTSEEIDKADKNHKWPNRAAHIETPCNWTLEYALST